MEKKQILADVQEIFRDVFDEEDLLIRDETCAEDIEDWDSLAQIRLTVAIEKRFGIKFAFGELLKLNNVGEMAEIIKNKAEAK